MDLHLHRSQTHCKRHSLLPKVNSLVSDTLSGLTQHEGIFSIIPHCLIKAGVTALKETKDAYDRQRECDRQHEWEETHPPPTLHVSIHPDYAEALVKGYKKDPLFKHKWEDKTSDPHSWYTGKHFYKDQDGLLFFRDADFMLRLCIPKSHQASILREAHKSPYQTAHAGPEKLWLVLSGKFYWPRMRSDVFELPDLRRLSENQAVQLQQIQTSHP